MGSNYQTPGVPIDEIGQLPLSVAEVETAIPAFIGYTSVAKALVTDDLRLRPTRIESMADYERLFGGPQPENAITVTISAISGAVAATATAALPEPARSRHILHYALQLYFANGGGPCLIVSVGACLPIGSALKPDDFAAGLAAIETAAATLVVIPEAVGLAIADYRALMDKALAQCARRQDRFVIIDAHGGSESLADPHADLGTAVANFRSAGIGADNLRYGAAYAPHLETTLTLAYAPESVRVLVVTDGVAAAAVSLADLQVAGSPHVAPAEAAIQALGCTLPPAAAVAGGYAATDRDRGVWKAPANFSLNAVRKPTIACSDAEQAAINIDPVTGKSVNVIRQFTGKGTRVWGARTLMGNDNEWRYINVRRLVIVIEQSVSRALQPLVFEPNDARSWARAEAMIENFLTMLWRRGALQGVKPDQAFFVAVGLGRTMTAVDVAEGRMIVQLGIAVARPAEFIVLRLVQQMASG